MTILEIVKKLEENNRQQSNNAKEIQSLKDELTRKEIKKLNLKDENTKLKRQQIKVEISDVVKQLKKDWNVECVFTKVEPIRVRRVDENREWVACSAEEICNLARGSYLKFTFRAGNRSAQIIRPFEPEAIQKTGRKLRDLVDVEIAGRYERRAYHEISFRRDEVKNYIFEGSVGSFISGDSVVVIQAGLNREIEEENAKYE